MTATQTRTRRFFFTGMKHVGKSSLARIVAAGQNWRHFDSDDELLKAAQKHYPSLSGIREYYQLVGNERFRDTEQQTLKALAQQSTGISIVSLGGGIADNPPAVDYLQQQQRTGAATVLYICDDQQRIFQRIINKGIPPFLNSADPQGSFSKLFRARDAVYRSICDVVFDVNGEDLDSAAARLSSKMQEYLNGRQ